MHPLTVTYVTLSTLTLVLLAIIWPAEDGPNRTLRTWLFALSALGVATALHVC